VVQVEPIKATLKAPGTELLKPKCDNLPSNFGFKFILRRYNLMESTSTSLKDVLAAGA
jgi:hypothetical protein